MIIHNINQEVIVLQHLFSNVEIMRAMRSHVKDTHFAVEYRVAIGVVLKFFDKHSSLPTMDYINGYIDSSFQKLVSPVNVNSIMIQELNEVTIKHIKCWNMYDLCVGLSEVLDHPEQQMQILEKGLQVMDIDIDPFTGTDYYRDLEKTAQQALMRSQKYSTGIFELDRQLNGGISKTEMMLISAISGGGKSIGMQNIALALANQNLNVLYITLELSELMISGRINQMLVGENQDKITNNIDIYTQQIRDTKRGNIHVKYMPGTTTRSRDIQGYLEDLYNEVGYYPDALICDYLDLLAPNNNKWNGNVAETQRQSSTELANLGKGNNPMIIITASQETKDSRNSKSKNQSNIAGAIAKVDICDVYLSIIMDDDMRSKGNAIFKLLKTRSSSGVGNSIAVKWDKDRLFFENSDNITHQPKKSKPVSKPIFDDEIDITHVFGVPK